MGYGTSTLQTSHVTFASCVFLCLLTSALRLYFLPHKSHSKSLLWNCSLCVCFSCIVLNFLWQDEQRKADVCNCICCLHDFLLVNCFPQNEQRWMVSVWCFSRTCCSRSCLDWKFNLQDRHGKPVIRFFGFNGDLIKGGTFVKPLKGDRIKGDDFAGLLKGDLRKEDNFSGLFVRIRNGERSDLGRTSFCVAVILPRLLRRSPPPCSPPPCSPPPCSPPPCSPPPFSRVKVTLSGICQAGGSTSSMSVACPGFRSENINNNKHGQKNNQLQMHATRHLVTA